MNKLGCGALAVLLAFGAENAQSSVLYAFEETGSGVVGAFSGTVDLTDADLIAGGSIGDSIQIAPKVAELVNIAGFVDAYAISGPSSFGSESATGAVATSATSADGPLFGLSGIASELYLPRGYTSGDPLSGGLTFAGANFAGLGITSGVYVFSLPNDTVTLRFGPAAIIPLPATLPLLLGALGLAALATRRHA